MWPPIRYSTLTHFLLMRTWTWSSYIKLWITPIEYVRGRVHTNGLENFWSLLKRGIKGTYVSVEPFHLARYLDEETFRYNNRDEEIGDAGRFSAALAKIVGKRLTYDELTGKAAMEKRRHMLN